MEYTLSLVWLGLSCFLTVSHGASLLQGDAQELSFPSQQESSTLASPPLGSIVRSLYNPIDDGSSVENDPKPSYPSRGNIHRSFSYVTTTTTQKTTPHFEALTGVRNETKRSRPRAYFVDNQRAEAQNSEELVDKFKTLRTGQSVSYGRPSTTPSYNEKSYEEEVDERRSTNGYSGPSVNVQQVPIRHWSTESNIIREDDSNGSLRGFSYVTPTPSTGRPPNFRGNVKYGFSTTQGLTDPMYGPNYDSPRSGKTLPPQDFSSRSDNRRAYVPPTTYRPQFPPEEQGAYSFSIRTRNHSRHESGDSQGYFRGSVKFTDTFGRDKQIHYEGNPEKGLVTSEPPYVTVAGRTGQRYVPPVTSPRPFTQEVPAYSYSYTTSDPLGTSTVAYTDFRSGKSPIYPVTESYGYSTPTSFSSIPTPDGAYRFSYDAGDHRRQEIRDRDGNVHGMYSFDDSDGTMKLVQYEANAQNGFVPQGQHLPMQEPSILTGQPLYYEEQPSDGSYSFSYNAGNHARQEIRDSNGNVRGYYTFLTGDGEVKTVHYRANPVDGFIASGDHIPAHGGGYSMSYRSNQK